jgi:hypothetical protein
MHVTKNDDPIDCPACKAGLPLVRRYYVTDTSRLSSAEKLAIAAVPGGVIEQETRGQQELIASSQLPTEGLLGADRPHWEALGVTILDNEASDDPLFCCVDLPAGWRKVPTKHPLWTDLVDEGGTIIATICYKAAFYDRAAHVSLKVKPALTEPECVCAECGQEQPLLPGPGAGGMGPCVRCHSVRVVSITVVRDLFGENWREAFDPDKADKITKEDA